MVVRHSMIEKHPISAVPRYLTAFRSTRKKNERGKRARGDVPAARRAAGEEEKEIASRAPARSLSLAAFAALALVGAALHASAQPAYPAKAVHIFVGFAPGGLTDLAARTIAAKLTAAWGQAEVVDNRTGANGAVAAELTARAAPDGHTLYMASSGHNTNPLLQDKVLYDPIKDFTAVSLIAHIPNILVIHPSVPARSVKEIG